MGIRLKHDKACRRLLLATTHSAHHQHQHQHQPSTIHLPPRGPRLGIFTVYSPFLLSTSYIPCTFCVSPWKVEDVHVQNKWKPSRIYNSLLSSQTPTQPPSSVVRHMMSARLGLATIRILGPFFVFGRSVGRSYILLLVHAYCTVRTIL